MTNLTEMKSTELKAMAKALGVKNWWVIPKAELVKEIAKAQKVQAALNPKPEVKSHEPKNTGKAKDWYSLSFEDDKPEVRLPELTELESQLMAQIPQSNYYEDELDSILWTGIFLDEISIPNKEARGVLSSLGKKKMLALYTDLIHKGEGNESNFKLTALGKEWVTQYLNGSIKVEQLQEVKKAKKVKGTKVKKEKATTEENGDLITLKEITSELGVKGTKARRILREKNIERPYKRWEWHKEQHKEIIQQIKGLLK